LDSLLRWWWSG